MSQAIIIRHKKENLKKCSLRGLESEEYFKFYTYPSCINKEIFCTKEPYFCLSFEGPLLSTEDRDSHLVLIDGTWKLAEKIYNNVPRLKELPKRSLPKDFITAYPRRQDDCMDPSRGLASVEALYIAYKIMGLPCDRILDNYHWKNEFLAKNAHLLG